MAFEIVFSCTGFLAYVTYPDLLFVVVDHDVGVEAILGWETFVALCAGVIGGFVYVDLLHVCL